MTFIKKNWFLICLFSVLTVGFLGCKPLEPVVAFDWLKWLVVCTTMFLMAWPLELKNIQSTLTKPGPSLLACALNLIAIPLLAWPVSMLVGPELGPGIIIAGATPSTLASAAVLTRRAGGNDGIAVLVTILTNATCFLVLPFWIYIQTGNQIESSQLIGTIYKLLAFVVVPIFLGQLVRLHAQSANWATRNKPSLSIAALIGILIMVLLGSVKLGLRFAEADQASIGPIEISLTIVALSFIHLFTFWLGFHLSKQIGLNRESQIAVAFSGSQKTLMIGLGTAVSLGMSFIPIVLYHTIQLITDAYIAERLSRQKQD